MSDTATCAACGETKELCESVRIEGLKQPRICKDCLLRQASTGEDEVGDLYWFAQILRSFAKH